MRVLKEIAKVSDFKVPSDSKGVCVQKGCCKGVGWVTIRLMLQYLDNTTTMHRYSDLQQLVTLLLLIQIFLFTHL